MDILDVHMNGTVDAATFKDLVLDVREYGAPGSTHRLTAFEEELRRTIKVARKSGAYGADHVVHNPPPHSHTHDHFVWRVHNTPSRHTGVSLDKLFDTFDSDHDGHVSRDEFASVLRQLADASKGGKLRMGEGDMHRLFRRFDSANTGSIQYADFKRFVDGSGSGSVANGLQSPSRLRQRHKSRSRGVNMEAARHKLVVVLLRKPHAREQLLRAFQRADPGNRRVVHASLFESVVTKCGVPFTRSERLALVRKFRKSQVRVSVCACVSVCVSVCVLCRCVVVTSLGVAYSSQRDPRLVKWIDFMDWGTPEMLRSGSDAAALVRLTRNTIQAKWARCSRCWVSSSGCVCRHVEWKTSCERLSGATFDHRAVPLP